MVFSRLFKRRHRTEVASDSNGVIREASAEVIPEASEISDELVAVITAAIQSSLDYDPHSRLVVRSIKRTGQTSPVWNRTGKLERIGNQL